MATIINRTNKAGELTGFKVMCCVGRDEHGKQIWRTTTIKRQEGLTPAKERKEVQRQADAWEVEQKTEYSRTHSKTARDKITFTAFVRDHWWTDHVMDGTHTPSSVAFYRYMSNDLLEYFGEKTRLNQIDAEAVKRYISFMNNKAVTKKGEPYGKTTVQHHFSTLRNIMEYARRLHYISADPCTDLSPKEKPHREKKGIDFLEVDEARKFLSCLENEPLFWRALFNVLLTTGLRRGECVGLQWGDIDAENLTLTIERNVTIDASSETKQHVGGTKTGESRVVPLSPRVYKMLMELHAEQTSKYGLTTPRAFIFCKDNDPYQPLYVTNVTRTMRKLVKRYGLRNVSPHDLRHSAASLALESGADLKQVQTLLGHADPSTTLKFYAGLSQEQERRTVEGIESLLTTG